MNPLQKLEEKLQQVKRLVFEDVPVQPATVEVPMYSLADGTKLKITELVVGGIVTMEDGTPAPVGSHTLEDGTTIEVAEGGTIAAITPKEQPAPGEDMNARFASYEEKFTSYEQKFQASEQRFATLESANNNLKAAFDKSNEALQGLIGLVETIVKEPSQEPAQVPNTFRKNTVISKDEKIKSFSDSISKILNK
jgi:flagellar capping protein FliD